MSPTKQAVRSAKKPSRSAKKLFVRGSEVARYKPLTPLPGEEKLFKDIERYRQMVLDMGAFEAIIFPAQEFPQDIRVWWRCQIPRCPASGLNPHCPPLWHTPWEDAKKLMKSYRYCIIYKVHRDAEFWTGRQLLTVESDAGIAKYFSPAKREQAKRDLDEYVEYLANYKKKPISERSGGTARIGPVVVEQARRDGYHFATTYGVGSCVFQRCAKFGATCVEMNTGICRYPLKVSPEGSAAVYQDFVTLSAMLGWDTYVAGHCLQPEDAGDVPYYIIGTIYIK